MSDIRVVIVAYNPGPELGLLIDSLPEAIGADYEVVVVNNGASNEILNSLTDRVSVVNSAENLGYGKGNNLGAKGFSGSWLLIVNPDVRCHRGSISRMLEVSKDYPRAGVFGPQIRTPEGEIYPSVRAFPRLVSGTGHALFSKVWPQNPWTAYYRRGTERTGAVDWLSGACLLIRRQAFEDVGGFDPNFFMFFEDTKLGEDMRSAGWERVFVKDAIVTHDQGKSWREKPAAMQKAHHDSAYRYLAGIYDRPWQAPLRLVLKAGLGARAAIGSRRRDREARR